MCWREKAKSALKREKIANVLQHLNVVKAVQNKLTYLKEERGAIFVLTALLLPIMFGCLGIAYDVGNVYIHKARLQNVTDAAALAVAVRIWKARRRQQVRKIILMMTVMGMIVITRLLIRLRGEVAAARMA